MSVNASGSKFPNTGPSWRQREGSGPRAMMVRRGEKSGIAGRAPSAGFGKSKRLLKHADFQRVYRGGRRQFTGNMTVFFLRRPGEDDARLRVGFTVGKVLGGAVDRNRIKRRMREAVRLVSPGWGGLLDVIFHPRKSVLTLPFAELQSEVGRGLRLAEQRARVEATEK
jgi:ribonuclease P protein component